MTDIGNALYLFAYFITILYFVVLGCYMLAQHGSTIYTHGEMKMKRRMMRSVGAYMIIWAVECLAYLPFILIHGYEETQKGYDLCTLFTLMLNTPALYMVMHAVVQRKVNTLRWMFFVGMPYLVLMLWHLFTPAADRGRWVIYIAEVLTLLNIVFLIFRYYNEYRTYVRRVRSEYSDISGRRITWTWSCFMGFALQSVIYIVYQIYWTPVLEFIYMGLSILNATYLCYCTCKMKPLDDAVVEELPLPEDTPDTKFDTKEDTKAFYSIIEQKLESLCEGRHMFLEPDLTRESLCVRLSIGRTYLSMYFRSRDTTFYQYINSLRVDYAVRLMQENPTMPIRKVSELSGFRSQTTFRKVFHEVMGCLPSEIV